MTPTHTPAPPSAATILDLCAPHIKIHTARGAIFFAAGITHSSEKPAISRSGCLLYAATGPYILYPDGSIRRTNITKHMFAQVRQYHNLSQVDLAAILHVTPETVANKERGRSPITHRDILTLVAVLRNSPPASP